MTISTFRVPPEWERQAGLLVGWPHLRHEWGGAFDGARKEIAGFIHAASQFQPVYIVCGTAQARADALAHIGESSNITYLNLPAGDIWLRDTGPILAEKDGKAHALTFAFNGWGGKFIMPGDHETAAAIAGQFKLPPTHNPFILEGGAIEMDGAGRLITTRQCLLNPNRNKDWDEGVAKAELNAAFGVQQVIWLTEGLRGDHTDGHVDNLARFVGPGHVVCQSASGSDDPNADILKQVENELRAADLKVTRLPSPGRICGEGGACLAASHMNFTLMNGAVLLPVYEPAYSAEAGRVLQDLFPDRELIARPAGQILRGGGSFHCMTREIPHFVKG